ncbi:MAG: hypothetical protein U0798_05995 [Gemmataceae bacterium]
MKSKKSKKETPYPAAVPSSGLAPDPTQAQPVAEPTAPMDGAKPIPAGTDELEKFLVTTDTNGGE